MGAWHFVSQIDITRKRAYYDKICPELLIPLNTQQFKETYTLKDTTDTNTQVAIHRLAMDSQTRDGEIVMQAQRYIIYGLTERQKDS